MKFTMHRDLIKGIVFVALGATSYGILATFVKMAYQQGFTTAEVTSSQFLLGFAGLLFLNLIFRKKISVSDKNAGRNSVLKLILAGTSLGLTSLFYYYSVKYVPVSMGIVLLMQTTWMGIVLEMILARKLPSPGKISAVIGVLIGTALSTNLITNWQSIDLRGIGWGIMAALSYTIAVFSSNRIALELPFFETKSLVNSGRCFDDFILIFFRIWVRSLIVRSFGNGVFCCRFSEQYFRLFFFYIRLTFNRNRIRNNHCFCRNSCLCF
ncbi:EamA family transporter [Pseudarcicella hirudinis]|uniref:EamA family transporter n=1 Tax=Pseudarcicella hirudinis TaxID=1079859 RepID=UPI0035E4CC95